MKTKAKTPFAGRRSKKFPNGIGVSNVTNHRSSKTGCFRLECTPTPAVKVSRGSTPKTDIRRKSVVEMESIQSAQRRKLKFNWKTATLLIGT